MKTRYITLTCGCATGVFDTLSDGWAVEPEYTWAQSLILATKLNQQPDIEPDELYKLVEVKA